MLDFNCACLRKTFILAAKGGGREAHSEKCDVAVAFLALDFWNCFQTPFFFQSPALLISV